MNLFKRLFFCLAAVTLFAANSHALSVSTDVFQAAGDGFVGPGNVNFTGHLSLGTFDGTQQFGSDSPSVLAGKFRPANQSARVNFPDPEQTPLIISSAGTPRVITGGTFTQGRITANIGNSNAFDPPVSAYVNFYEQEKVYLFVTDTPDPANATVFSIFETPAVFEFASNVAFGIFPGVNVANDRTITTVRNSGVKIDALSASPTSAILGFTTPSTSNLNVQENAGSATLVVTRSGNTSSAVSVNYATQNGTATAGSDFTATSGTLSFAANETTKSFDIPISNDTSPESNESLTVTLTSPSSGAVLGSSDSVTVTILGNDSVLDFASATYSVNENGGNVTVVVSRAGGSTSPVTVDFDTANGTATSGSDYTNTTGTLTFASGESSKNIVIPIVDNSVYEEDETFTVRLSAASGGSLGSPSTTTVTINDNESAPVGEFQFSSSAITTSEASSSRVLTVQRVNGSVGAATVAYATANGSAAAGSDYTATGGTLSFANGETSKTFSVPIINDATPENDETFTADLSNPTGGATLGTPSSVTVTIEANDSAFRLSASTYTVDESQTSVTITVQRSGGSTGSVTVNYATSNGTAIAGNDYTSSSGTLTFASDDNSQTFSVPIVNNTFFENDETFTVRLSSPSSGTTLGAPDDATVTITDGDSPSALDFRVTTAAVEENSGTLIVTVDRGNAGGVPVNVQFATANGTAAAGSDYTNTSGTMNFSATETSKTISIPILNDSVSENDESFTITLSSPSSGGSLGSQSIFTATIPANDSAFRFTSSNFSEREDSGPATITVERIGGSSTPVSVNFATTDGTATSGLDYIPTSVTLSFASGEDSKTVSVRFTDDTFYEGGETVNITLSTPSTGAFLASPSSAVLTIEENDPSSAGAFILGAAAVTTEENSGSIVVTVNRISGSEGAASVTYGTSNGSALAGSDYMATTGTLNFANGETRKTFTIPIINDASAELAETFSVVLSNPSGRTIILDPSTEVVTIAANDSSFKFATSVTSTEEGVNAVLNILRIGGSTGPVSINVKTANGSALASADFPAINTNVIFGPGETSKSISIPITNDSVPELAESFTANLTVVTNGTTVTSPASNIITIGANDSAFRLSANNYPTSEGSSLEIVVERQGGSSTNATVNIAVTNGTASAGSDFTSIASVLTFVPGESSKVVSLTILQDITPETAETINITLANPSAGATVVSPFTAVATIAANDSTFSLSAANFTAAEGSTLSIIVRRVGNSTAVETVNIATNNGSASSTSDYGALSTIVSFSPGQTSQTVRLSIVNDTLPEFDETLQVVLSQPSQGALLGTVSRAVVKIPANDSSFQLASSSYKTTEGSNLRVIVTRVGDSNTPVSVAISTLGGSAVANKDFSNVNSVLTFNSGETSKSISIPITNDLTAENVESFNIKLSGPSPGTTLGLRSSATVSISGNDSVFRLSSSSFVAREGTSLPVVVQRIGGASGPVSIRLSTSTGSAQSPSDFSAVSSVIIFNEGETSKTVILPILNDSGAESSETFRVALSSPSAGTTLGSPNSGTVTIPANDTNLRFTVSGQTVSEATGSASVVIQRAGDLSRSTTVSYATLNGSALAGSDYRSTSGTATFAPGESSKRVAISILNDATAEGAETFAIRLSSPSSGVLLASPSTTKITIEANDSNFRLSSSLYRATEGNSLQLSVIRVGGSANAVTVQLTTNPGTASSPADFRSISETLTFLPGESRKTVFIPIVNDVAPETLETFAVILTSPSTGTTLASPSRASVSIAENDPVATFRLENSATSAIEGQPLTFKVIRGGAQLDKTLAVKYTAIQNTALAGSDFVASGATLTFGPNVREQIITINTLDDVEAENNENFRVVLSKVVSNDPTIVIVPQASTVATILTNSEGTDQPDLLVAPKSAVFTGNDVYNATGDSQIAVQNGGSGEILDYIIRLSNDGPVTDSFNLTASQTSSGSGSSIQYFLNGKDVTSQILAPQGSTIALAPFPILNLASGRSVDLAVKVKLGSSGTGASTTLRAESATTITKLDVARVVGIAR